MTQDALAPRAEDLIQGPREAIAIVGLGCRFPGGADTPAKFWELLTQGGDAIIDVPKDRWNPDRFYDEDHTKPGKMYMRKGGFLRERIDTFDPTFFGISPREAMFMDPQQRLLLEVSWEALEDAGLVAKSLAGSQTGVYIGAFTLDSMVLQLSPLNRENINSHHTATAATMTMLANRVSYIFDFHGPSVTMDTACSSSLVAFHYACQGIWQGECSMALAGGVNIMLVPEFPMVMCKGHFLAPDGHCKSFDERADGYSRGEGCGVVVLKPLSAALRDGDPIYALVRGTGVNQDGRTDGITVPSAEAQEALIREVYQRSNVDPRNIRYVEAHGTGTPVGDPIEASVLGKTIGAGRANGDACPIGSVKANIGHLEAAAGIAAVIKSSLCLKHGLVPPLANLQNPNPNIPFDDLGLRLPRSVEQMPAGDGPALVGINSFGYGGTNAHAVLEQAPISAKAEVAEQAGDPPAYVLPLAASSEDSLRGLAQSYATWLSQPEDTPSLKNISYSASVRRSHFDHRMAVVGNSNTVIAERLQTFLNEGRAEDISAGQFTGTVPKPVFVFSGMGPQWWAMGRQLLETETLFRQTAEEVDAVFRKIAGWSILDAMKVEESASRLAETEIAQPANFLLQVALAALWRSWGIEPSAIIGHSVGEVSAAYVSGSLNLEDAVQVAYHRSRLQQTLAGKGKMLAVGLSPAEALKRLDGIGEGICIAAVNSPTAVTLSGDPKAIDALAAELEAAGIFNSVLRVTVAYHSHQMEQIKAELDASLAGIHPSPPSIPVYSTVTGKLEESKLFDAVYWYKNIRYPVLFGTAMDQMVDDGYTLFLEVGPHPVLSSSMNECLMRHGVNGDVISTLRRKEPELPNMLKSLGRLYTIGYPVAWNKVYPQGDFVTLPSYAWQRARYWQETELAAQDRLGAVVHPFLGTPVSSALAAWEGDLRLTPLQYLSDHVVDGVCLFPASGYVEAGLAIHRLIEGNAPAVLEELQLVSALSLDFSKQLRVQWVFDEKTREYRAFSHAPSEKAGWTLHASARISPAPPGPSKNLPLPVLQARCVEHLGAEDLYARMRGYGLQYGACFQAVAGLWRRSREVLAKLTLPTAKNMTAEGYFLHPSLLDGAFQSLIACIESSDEGAADSVYVPVRIRRIKFHGKSETPAWAYGRLTKLSKKSLEGDIQLCNEQGEVLVEIEGLSCAALHSNKADQARKLQQWTYSLNWEAAEPLAALEGPSKWVIFAGQPDFADKLKQSLTSMGASVVTCLRTGSDAELEQAVRETELSAYRGVVYLPGLDSTGADPVASAATARALRLIQLLGELAAPAPRLYIVTRGAQQVNSGEAVPGVATSPLIGLGRVTASEYPQLKCTLVDLDASGNEAAVSAEASRLATELLANSPEDAVALRGTSKTYVLRLQRASTREMEDAAATRRLLSAADGHAFTLEIGKSGSLDSLRFRQIQRREPAPGEVEVKIQAAALNFKDVLKVLGVLPEEVYQNTFHGYSLGMEAAGVITRVGAGVKDYKPGDAIVASLPGSFSSHVYVPVESLFAARQSDRINPFEAAGSPVAFMTAYYALNDIARLQRGEKVLIHAATGGVGLAAIQVAQLLGAEIYATAGSDLKRNHLRSLGVKHIFDSRTLDFADGIMAATKGAGVDVVLNSLSGEALLKSVSVMAPFGRFVEIGKRDIMENSRLPMLPFNRNLSFTAIDLDRMMVERPELIRKTLNEVWDRLCSAVFTPLPVKVFPASEMAEAFRYMAQSKQMGKIVVNMEETAGVSILPGAEAERTTRTDGTYLITGGFGGIGQELAKWLAVQGVRNIALVGRSGAASPEAKATVAELRSKGVTVKAVAADISEEAQVERLIAEIGAEMPPLKGIFHTAAVLDDGLLAVMNPERFERAMAPKALGAWHLHQHTQSQPLDFFVMLSSVAGWVGNPGQGNYAAANVFLDSLAQHRRAQGLPASSISLGAVADAGMVAENDQVAKHLERAGIHALPVSSVLDAIGRILRWEPAGIGVMDVDWTRWSQVLPGVKTCARYTHLLAESDLSGAGLDSRTLQVALAALPPEKRLDRLAAGIAGLVGDALQMPAEKVNLFKAFTEMGIDSLLGVELQTSLSIKLGIEVSVLELMKSSGIAQLAGDLLVKMNLAGADASGAAEGPEAAAESAQQKAVA